jgi:hypothetical protein
VKTEKNEIEGEKGCMCIKEWLKPIFTLFLPLFLHKLKLQISMIVFAPHPTPPSSVMPVLAHVMPQDLA